MKAKQVMNQVFFYCDRATIGVLKYISRRSLTAVERIFWAVCMILTLIASVYLINEAIEKFLARKIGFRLSDTRHKISKVPFPAVSICPEVLMNSTLLEQFSSMHFEGGVTYSDIITFMTTHESPELFAVMERIRNITQIEWFTRYGDNGVLATWLNRYTVPFSLILTQWGLCFDFNMIAVEELLHVDEVSTDFHYKANITNHVYIPSLDANALRSDSPFPWNATNSQRYLIIGFYGTSYVTENPYDELQGYHMIFHSNHEFPFANEKNHVRVGTSNFVTVDIIPVVRETDESLNELDVEERNCYLDGEKRLRFFKIYSRSNCEQECFSNSSMQSCGCVPFYTIRAPDARICTSDDHKCVKTIEKELNSDLIRCDCYPSCGFINYELKMYSERCGCSSTAVGFENDHYDSFVMYHMFGTSQLLASIGGFLSLIGGISVISLFEIVYFLGCRNMKQNNNQVTTETEITQSEQSQNSLTEFLKKYCKFSSIHGLNNASEGKFFGITFLLILIISVLFCSTTIKDSYDRTDTNPIVFKIDEKIWSSKEIPFPAVTMCPDLELDITRYNGIESNLSEHRHISDEDQKYFQTATLLCYRSEVFSKLSLLNKSIETIDLSSQVERFTRLEWFKKQKAEFHHRDVNFTEILTYNGKCFNFNMDKDAYNYNVISKDLHFTKSISLNRDSDQDFYHNALTFSFTNPYRRDWCNRGKGRVVIHHPANSPTIGLDYQKTASFYRMNYHTHVVITPNIITTEDKLRDLEINSRQCYFEGEKRLRFFKTYSKRNCLEECQSNLTLSSCGCMEFYHARDKSTRVCGLNDHSCDYDIMLKFQMQDEKVPEIEACGCLPSCNLIEYEISVIATKLEQVNQWTIVNNSYHWTGATYYGGVSISFGDTEYQALKRYANHESISFLSNVGGLLSLFLGVSVISLIEVFYFLFIRVSVELVRYIKLRRQRRESISRQHATDLTVSLRQLEF